MSSTTSSTTSGGIDSLVSSYVQKKEWIRKKAAAFKELMAPHKQALKTLEQDMLTYLLDNGLQSVKTEHDGTVYRHTSQRAKVTDWGALVEYVVANDAFDLLERRVVTSTAIERLQDEPVPGIEVDSYTTATVRSK